MNQSNLASIRVIGAEFSHYYSLHAKRIILHPVFKISKVVMWLIWILHIDEKKKKEASDQTTTSERDIMATFCHGNYLLYFFTRQSTIKLSQQRISQRNDHTCSDSTNPSPKNSAFIWHLLLFSDKHNNNINLRNKSNLDTKEFSLVLSFKTRIFCAFILISTFIVYLYVSITYTFNYVSSTFNCK